MLEIKLSPEAIIDLNEVIDFYANISRELGEKFIVSFDQILTELENFAHFQIRYDEVRIRQVKQFPIILHYVLYENTNSIIIYGIRFGQQNPENYPKI